MLWQEVISPLIVLEFVSGHGSEERDKTSWTGKFWVYEQAIRPASYGIYEVRHSRVEGYHLIEDHYELVSQNERGHYPIYPLGVELGIWQGRYQNMELPWLRWWDEQVNLLLTGEERAELEKYRADQTELLLQQERQQRELAQQRAELLAQRLKDMGVNLDEL